jgi:hypothetical protein
LEDYVVHKLLFILTYRVDKRPGITQRVPGLRPSVLWTRMQILTPSL